jgi:hypothetical protein
VTREKSQQGRDFRSDSARMLPKVRKTVTLMKSVEAVR